MLWKPNLILKIVKRKMFHFRKESKMVFDYGLFPINFGDLVFNSDEIHLKLNFSTFDQIFIYLQSLNLTKIQFLTQI